MKNKTIWSASSVLLLTFCLSACNWSGRVEQQGTKEMQLSTVSFEDSAEILEAKAYQVMRVVFPVEEDTSSVAQNILSWLCEQVSLCSYPDWSSEWPEKDLSLESVTPSLSQSNGSFGESIVNFYAQKGLEKMKETMSEEAADGFSGSYMNELEISLTEQTNEYLTLTLSHDIYTGGAHGSHRVEGLTFRKTDGKRLEWQMFDMDKRAEIIEKLKIGLKDYFGDVGESSIDSDEELFDCLMLFDDPDTPDNELEYGIPLPRTTPWLTKDGFFFMYQQYEIAAYAYGMPCCIIPADELKPLMSEEGKAWLTSVLQ